MDTKQAQFLLRGISWLVAVALAVMTLGFNQAPASAAEPKGTASISGIGTDPHGNALEGVTIVAYRWDPEGAVFEKEGSTHPDPFTGAYVLSGLLAGSYTLWFDAPAETGLASVYWGGKYWKSEAERFEVGSGQSVTGKDVQLEYGASVSGTVTGPGGNAVADVQLFVCRWDPQAKKFDVENSGAATNSTGHYELEGLRPGLYTLWFRPGWTDLASAYWGGKYWDSEAETFELELGQRVTGKDIQLERGAAVSGTVTDPDGKAIESVSVTPYRWDPASKTFESGLPVFTDGSGGYLLEGLRPGWYTLSFFDYWLNLEGVPLTYLGGGDSESDAERFELGLGQPPVIKNFQMPGVLSAGSPSVSGVVKVGGVLTAVPGSWGPGSVSLKYQWLRGGAEIVGATASTYLVQSGDVGSRLSVRVTGSKAGYESVVRVSAETGVVPVVPVPADPVFTSFPKVSVSGTAKAGKTLTGKLSGAWVPKPTTVSYQWLRDGVPISKATKVKYKIAKADGGAKLSLRVTASKSGVETKRVVSAVTKTIPLSKLKAATPKIKGTAKVGKTLKVSKGKWTAKTSVTFQWFRGATLVRSGTSYKLALEDIGKTIKVKATGVLQGYKTVVKTSKATKKVK